jgi:hypothetical protein
MAANSSIANSQSRRGSSRPARSQPPAEVIDLTGSPPRAAPLPSNHASTQPNTRVLIDLDAIPDVLPLPRRPRTMQTAPRRASYLPAEDITRTADVVMLGDDPPISSGGTIPNILNMLRNRFYGTNEPDQVHYHLHYHPEPRGNQFRPPGQLNYSLNAGHVYPDNGSLRDLPCFKDDTYTPPSPARQGYTRSPADNMGLICPMCMNELGKSADTPKKEVWVAKCGHVYCGTCAVGHRQNRLKGVKAGRCSVEGCSRIVSGDKGMMEVFL